MKKHWSNTEKEHTIENVIEDAQNFIELQTGKCVGYEEEGVYVTFLSWYEGLEFRITLNTSDTNLYKLQKEIYDYCKEWNESYDLLAVINVYV